MGGGGRGIWFIIAYKMKKKKYIYEESSIGVTIGCVLFGQAGRGRGVVARGRVGGSQARGPVRGGRNPATSGARGAQRPAARGGVRAKGSLPGEDGLYLHNESTFS